ncbi:hypothetical protein [Mesonia aestuariivivens]|uniref:Uncharacterized protein n=1 Tax=Mesonia aestuariivivens TaxID=2796128 RepID=A0ABS6VZE7_9FLAO|nr:hypothetical protein [Mesonia aestuariivivens]MBW2960963.1 hypothetical protein [Mesonia aestuariivivens]
MFTLFCCLIFGQSLDCDCGVSNQLTLSKNNSSCNPAPGFTASILQSDLDAFPSASFNLQVWIVNRSDGTNDKDYNGEQILQAINQLNNDFSLANICFNLIGVNFINDDYYYNIPVNDRFRLDTHVENNSNDPDLMNLNAVNIYLVQGSFNGQASPSYAMTTININSFF